MDRKSRCEPSPSESLWFCNLQLLGFGGSGSPVPLTQSMFDHSNPTGFHQVFFFLFKQLNSEKTKSEFRDCWPILEKKQESEFRRKVVNLLKEYQKESPMDLPYTNPSLFQSPGGRKFVAFLVVFSSFVIKMLINKVDENLLSKPLTKNSKLRKICFSTLVKMEKQALENATTTQADSMKIENESRDSMNKISEKYFALKQTKLGVEEDNDVEELRQSHSEFVVNGHIEKDVILEHYDKKCEKMKEMQENLKALSADHEENWENIISVVDDSLPQIKLNFNQFPKELVAENDLSMTYENMITKVIFTTGRVLEFQHPVLPTQAMVLGSTSLGSQEQLLKGLQVELGITVEKMQKHVQGMLNISTKIDWTNCELATSLPSAVCMPEGQVLLPPTPSMLDTMTGPPSKGHSMRTDLQLISPATPLPPSRAALQPADLSLGSTPVSTGQVSRRITRRVTPDPSPLLRQSLTHSRLARTNAKNEGGYNNHSQDSKDSLGVFSPVLCSTKSQNSSSCSQVSTSSVPTDSPDVMNTQPHNSTQSKIELYRKILLSGKVKDKSQDYSKSSLLTAWDHHRQSLSPGSRILDFGADVQSNHPSTPHRQFSPLLSCQTPDKSQLEMDSKLATRLDQLMTSLTFSDNSLDMSLGNMMMGEEMELLSPHCP